MYWNNGKPCIIPVYQRAERIRRMIWERAQKLCEEAGLMNYGHIHNALVGLENGKPWREVDYKKAKRAYYLFQTVQHRPERAVRRLVERKGMHAFDWQQC